MAETNIPIPTKEAGSIEQQEQQQQCQQLHIYMVAWAVHRIYEVAGSGNQTLAGWSGASQWAIVTLTVTALLLRSVRLWMLAMVATAATDISLMPFIWDSEYWCMLTDLTVLYSAHRMFGVRRLWFDYRPLPESDLARLYAQKVQPTIVAQMILFYFAAFFWKLNWDFLDPHSSCAPIFIMQLLDHFLPSTVHVPGIVLKGLTQSSPYAVLILEGYIAYAFTRPKLRPRGVLAAVLLHTGIAMCPPPSNVATFSLMCGSRLVLFVPMGALSAAHLGAWDVREISSIIVATAIAASLAAHPDFYDLAYPLFIGTVPFVIKAALLHGTETESTTANKPKTTASTPPASRLPVVLAFMYAYLCIVFGTMDQGQPHMYANLRLHGGSNHILGIPTSLFQKWFSDASHVINASSKNPFVGGIVRIESSTAKSLNEVYPGDYTTQMSERSRQFMITGGHTSRNFNPMLTAVTSSESPWIDETTSGKFVRYTMPAHEFRRVLETLRQAEDESFVIHYTQLFGSGDEEWRATANGRSVRLEERKDIKSGQRHIDCRVLDPATGESSECTSNDLPNLPPLPMWARKIMLFEPYPILEGDYKLHCFGP